MSEPPPSTGSNRTVGDAVAAVAQDHVASLSRVSRGAAWRRCPRRRQLVCSGSRRRHYQCTAAVVLKGDVVRVSPRVEVADHVLDHVRVGASCSQRTGLPIRPPAATPQEPQQQQPPRRRACGSRRPP